LIAPSLLPGRASALPGFFFAGIPRVGGGGGLARRLAGSPLPAGVGPPRRPARGAEADDPPGCLSAPGAGE